MRLRRRSGTHPDIFPRVDAPVRTGENRNVPTLPQLRDAHLLVVGSGSLADAVEAALGSLGADRISVASDGGAGSEPVDAKPAFVPGRSFDLLLDVDAVVAATGRGAARYLVNDAAAIRGIPVVWAVARDDRGEVGVGWDELGVDYRDVEPEDSAAADDAADVEPDTAVIDAVAALTATTVARLFSPEGAQAVGRVAAYDARTGRLSETVHRREPGVPRPGSLEERTVVPSYVVSGSVEADDLAVELGSDHPPLLLDVREPWEADLVTLPGATLIPLGELQNRLGELDAEAPIVAFCHHGVRSGRALAILEAAGFARARHLAGGIDAWSVLVDPELPRY